MRFFQLFGAFALIATAWATPDVDPHGVDASLSLYDDAPVPARLQPRSTASFKAAVLQAHNSNRRKHGARDLVWSDSLARSAAKWASRCVFEHGGTWVSARARLTSQEPETMSAKVRVTSLAPADLPDIAAGAAADTTGRS